MSRCHFAVSFRSLFVVASFALVASSAALSQAASYTFESLTAGTLAGQDAWVDFGGAGSNHSVTTVAPAHVGGSTKVATGFDQSVRVNDGNFSYNPHSATDTAALMEFDVRAGSGDTAVMALGRDLAFSTHSQLGPQFGIWGGLNTFMIRGAVEGGISQAALTGTDSVNDWYRLRMVVDFTANSGNGAGSLYVRNLTDGETDFRLAPVLSNINLQILNMETASENPGSWNSMYLRSAEAGTLFDDLNPNAFVAPPLVPEPSTCVLVSLGLTVLLTSRRRARLA